MVLFLRYQMEINFEFLFGIIVHMGIRPLRISTGEEEKVYASTAGKKKSRSSASVFRHRFLAVGFGETAAERGRTKPSPQKKNARVVFFSVRNR